MKRTIAYRTANHPKSRVANSLPADWITEHTYADLHPEGLLTAEDGWLFLDEDAFNALLAKSNAEDNLKKHKDKEDADRRAQVAAWKASREVK